jgi:indolepyruvate ferredoxin oxidoreductase
VQSNCVAILPVETDLGRKRQIDQSACNKDFSCLKGFCPSFVTVEGGRLRKAAADAGAGGSGAALPDPVELAGAIPPPVLHSLAEEGIDSTYNILVTGVGGTGVITVGALIGMAAHLEQRGVSVLDMTGMSQKNGAVTSHVRLAAHPESVRAQAIATGEADLVLGCDMLTAASADSIAKTRPGRTHAVMNTHQQPPGTFAQQRDWQFPDAQIRSLIDESIGERAAYVDASRLATALCGDAIATNLFMLGFAWQRGLVPLSFAALDRAIELNAVAVDANRRAFAWGRLTAHDATQVERLAAPMASITLLRPQTLESVLRHRTAMLTAYQSARYARRYTDFVEQVRQAEQAATGTQRLTLAVARQLAKLMAYKDEYEVARLYTDGEFARRIAQTFEGDYTLNFHLAPPLLARRDAKGHLVKRAFGPWMMRAFALLARFRTLRGGAFDIFGYTEERRTERRLPEDYRALILRLLPALSKDNLALAVQIANLPDDLRGFGHVKESALGSMHRRQIDLTDRYFSSPSGQPGAPPDGPRSAESSPTERAAA